MLVKGALESSVVVLDVVMKTTGNQWYQSCLSYDIIVSNEEKIENIKNCKQYFYSVNPI